MRIDIGRVFTGGVERVLTRNGLVLSAAWFLLALPSKLVTNDLIRQLYRGLALPTGPLPPGVPGTDVSPAVGTAVLLALSLVSAYVVIVALRTFVADERRGIPREFLTRDVGWTMLNVVVGGVVFTVAVTVGFLLVLPGLFLLVSLFFWQFFVVVEGENFVDAFEASWNLTEGHRLDLFTLGFAVVLAVAIAGTVLSIPRLVLPGLVGVAYSQAVSAPLNVFVFAAASETYTQLVATADEDEADDEFDDPPGAPDV